MAHFVKVENGIVTDGIVADQDVIDSGLFGNPSLWIQTSYNTHGNVHYGPDGKPDGGVALRGNYASVGYRYIKSLDVFVAPKPYTSWDLNRNTYLWEPPIPFPNDGNNYYWDEPTVSWVLAEQ
jgi:hypothetical protein